MFKTILVPLDGSAMSEQALPSAVSLAKTAQAHLVLVQAAWATTPPGIDASQAQLAAVTEAEIYLTRIARRLRATGLIVEIATPYARPAEGILLEVKLHQADLVIMTTHGRSGPGRWVYGSVAEAVLAKSPAPVWLIRGNKAGARPSLAMRHPAKLLIPLDGSTFAEAVLPYAVAIAQTLHWTVILMRVLTPPVLQIEDSTLAKPFRFEKQLIQDEEEARFYLQEVATRLKGAGVQVETVLSVGQAADAILEESWMLQVALVALATHGRSGLSRMLYGSVAHAVLHRGANALLLVRPNMAEVGLDTVTDLAISGEAYRDGGKL